MGCLATVAKVEITSKGPTTHITFLSMLTPCKPAFPTIKSYLSLNAQNTTYFIPRV